MTETARGARDLKVLPILLILTRLGKSAVAPSGLVGLLVPAVQRRPIDPDVQSVRIVRALEIPF